MPSSQGLQGKLIAARKNPVVLNKLIITASDDELAAVFNINEDGTPVYKTKDGTDEDKTKTEEQQNRVPLGIRALCHAIYEGDTILIQRLSKFAGVYEHIHDYLYKADGYVYQGSIGGGGIIDNTLLSHRHKAADQQIKVLNVVLAIPGMRKHVVEIFKAAGSFPLLRPVMLHLMQFPEVFAKADSGPDSNVYLVRDFIENYCVVLAAKQAQAYKRGENPVFNPNSDAAKIAILVLRNLMRTYNARDQIRADYHFTRRYALSQTDHNNFLERGKLYANERLEKTLGINFHLQRIRLIEKILTTSGIVMHEEELQGRNQHNAMLWRKPPKASSQSCANATHTRTAPAQSQSRTYTA